MVVIIKVAWMMLMFMILDYGDGDENHMVIMTMVR